jgi:hypothetical protein
LSELAVTIEGGFATRPGNDFARYVTRLNDSERVLAERDSGVKHPHLFGSAPCFATLAGRALLKRMAPRNTGVICTGGPWALAACSSFIGRANEAGPGLVNPLQFPATLVSAVATVAASLLEAHAFAYVVGYDRLAFFEALHRASSAIHYGFATQVFVLAISSSGSVAEAARANAGLYGPALDASIGFGITAGVGQETLRLLGVYVDSNAPASGGELYGAEWRGDAFSCEIDTPLDGGEAYGACGAVLCIAAAQHHATARDPKAAFAVRARVDARSATAIFQWMGEAAGAPRMGE